MAKQKKWATVKRRPTRGIILGGNACSWFFLFDEKLGTLRWRLEPREAIPRGSSSQPPGR